MKTLTLLRHAKSGWDDPVERDFDRPLNAKGMRAAVLVGRHMRSLELAFDHVIASPAVRVMETLDYIGQGLGRRLAPAWDRRAYLASAATLIDMVHDLPVEARSVLLVGHNPGLEELALTLVKPESDGLRSALEQKYPTATVAELHLPAEQWGDVQPESATLARFVRPRDLDPTLGPDEF